MPLLRLHTGDKQMHNWSHCAEQMKGHRGRVEDEMGKSEHRGEKNQSLHEPWVCSDLNLAKCCS